MTLPVPVLGSAPDSPFPPVGHALRDPDGLLAVGGDLHPERLLGAYRQGIFPWYSPGEPILWWSPDPRMVFRTDRVHLSRRFRRSLRNNGWQLRADTAFGRVVDACADIPRRGQRGTWITDAMRQAYLRLHRLGHAHSVEVFDGNQLAGGIYGVSIGRMFFGESMFSGRDGGSKVALAGLALFLQQNDWPLIDAQVENPHLLRMGAERMPREAFVTAIDALAALPGQLPPSWSTAFGIRPAADLAQG